MKITSWNWTVLALLSACVAPFASADLVKSDVAFSITSAVVDKYQDRIDLFFQVLNPGTEDYCELQPVFGKTVFTDPYVFYSDAGGKKIDSDFALPQFTNSPMEPEIYLFGKIPAGTNRIDKIETWDDHLPEDRAELLNIKIKIGRILFPCSSVGELNFPKLIKVSDIDNMSKLKKLFKSAKYRLVTSSAAPIKLSNP